MHTDSVIDVETDAASANTGTGLIDVAIEKVNIHRSELGAVSNRLNHTVNNLTNISSNLSAAKGGIEDADFALETTNLAKTRSCSKRPPRCWPKPTHPSRTFSACCKAKRKAKLRCKTINIDRSAARGPVLFCGHEKDRAISLDLLLESQIP